MSKRLLVLSDLHCGHLAGLAPPRWQIKPGSETNLTKREKFAAVQEDAWRWYANAIRKHGPYDVVVVNGDAIDGQGTRSGGTELLTADREEQADMATYCIRRALSPKTKHVVMTYGTAYHTGDAEDWENKIAANLSAKIGSHEWIDVEGVIFDLKHHLGGSGVPHGRATALSREALWAALWAETDMAPNSDVLIRSHVHYHAGSFDLAMKPNLRMTTPALQAFGSKYGSRRCSGIVNLGFLVFECQKKTFTFECVHARLRTQKASVLRC